MLKPFRQFLFIRLRNRQHGRREQQLNNFEQTCLHSFNRSRQLTQGTRIYVYFKWEQMQFTLIDYLNTSWSSLLVLIKKDQTSLGDLFYNHNYNKIVKSDWLSTALISALIGQFDRTVRVMPK